MLSTSGNTRNICCGVGDHVAVQPTICCYKCSSCEQNFLNCCDKVGFVGLSGGGGDFVCVDGPFVHKLPPNVSLDVGGIVTASSRIVVLVSR